MNCHPCIQAAGSGMFCDLDTLLCQEHCPALAQLAPLAKQHLPCICDVKGCGEDQYYRLNQTKVGGKDNMRTACDLSKNVL